MFTLIENGHLFDPTDRGTCSVLLANSKIIKIGKIDRRNLDALDVAYEHVDAAGHIVIPGLIDPHEHLAGASGKGFGAETPPIFLSEIVSGGVTTVVGTLGTDVTTMPMARLLARVKCLEEAGLTAYCYCGGYHVPPATITGSLQSDILLFAEFIGAGEISISDERSSDPSLHELARAVSEAHVAGLLSGKAGISHFHVGPRSGRLEPLRRLVEDFDIEPGWLYPTHVGRSEELMLEAIAFTKRGAYVDIDVVEKDLPQWLGFYMNHGGEPDRCTVSSDAFATSPKNLLSQIRSCVLEHKFSLGEVLRCATSNTAQVLGLCSKGRVVEGGDADVVLLEEASLELTDVFARGQPLVRGGEILCEAGFLAESDRQIELRGRREGA